MQKALLVVAGVLAGLLPALIAIAPHMVRRAHAIPWLSLGWTLALVLAVGMLAGMAAVRAMLRVPLLAALRGD